MKQAFVGIGEILWDMFPEGKKLGGAPANFAFHVSQFGFDSYAVSAIGDDALGEEIIHELDKKGLKYILPKTAFPTGTVHVELDCHGVPEYRISENVAWDNIPLTDEMKALAARTKVVCFGSLAQRSELSRQTINQFIDLIPQPNFRIFDVNLRQNFYTKEILLYSLGRCNIVKINEDELVEICKLMGYENMTVFEVAKQLFEDLFRISVVILTKGTKGSYVITREVQSFHETPLVEVADTVGAGDSFTAAFISNLLLQRGFERSHEAAVKLSAYVCSQHGAMPKFPRELMN